ncbi:MAG: response regulator [Bacteroidia bacterium]|nr:response regulator [Bacteroidia bacterium]
MNQQKKILIIDDDTRNIFALSAILRSSGFNCISSIDAKEGKNLMIQQADIGIILIDMMMPDMDGYEAIPFLRLTPGYSKIPIIAVTAQAMPGDREKCIEAGATDYISKPIDIDKLILVVDQYLLS